MAREHILEQLTKNETFSVHENVHIAWELPRIILYRICRCGVGGKQAVHDDIHNISTRVPTVTIKQFLLPVPVHGVELNSETLGEVVLSPALGADVAI